jgi:hypothetical protein
MNISEADLAELKQLYLNAYDIELTNEKARELAIRLLTLFNVIGKKLPEGGKIT